MYIIWDCNKPSVGGRGRSVMGVHDGWMENGEQIGRGIIEEAKAASSENVLRSDQNPNLVPKQKGRKSNFRL